MSPSDALVTPPPPSSPLLETLPPVNKHGNLAKSPAFLEGSDMVLYSDLPSLSKLQYIAPLSPFFPSLEYFYLHVSLIRVGFKDCIFPIYFSQQILEIKREMMEEEMQIP